jgi:hypothetical protein
MSNRLHVGSIRVLKQFCQTVLCFQWIYVCMESGHIFFSDLIFSPCQLEDHQKTCNTSILVDEILQQRLEK